MAAVQQDIDNPGVTRPMTYEEYIASPEEMARYDILDGWKVYRRYGEEQLTNPTIRHQRIQRRVARAFEEYEEKTGIGLAVEAPCDVMISRLPLRNRQPDIFFISNEDSESAAWMTWPHFFPRLSWSSRSSRRRTVRPC